MLGFVMLSVIMLSVIVLMLTAIILMQRVLAPSKTVRLFFQVSDCRYAERHYADAECPGSTIASLIVGQFCPTLTSFLSLVSSSTHFCEKKVFWTKKILTNENKKPFRVFAFNDFLLILGPVQ